MPRKTWICLFLFVNLCSGVQNKTTQSIISYSFSDSDDLQREREGGIAIPLNKTTYVRESDEFTVCLRFILLEGREVCPLSRAGGLTIFIHKASEGIGFVDITNDGAERAHIFYSPTGSFPMDKSISLCILFANYGGVDQEKITKFVVYGNEELWIDTLLRGSAATPNPYQLDSEVIIGYATVSKECFFRGLIADLNVWTRSLTHEEMKSFTASVEKGQKITKSKKVLDWEHFDHSTLLIDNQSVLILESFLEPFGSENQFEVVDVRIQKTYQEARDFCNIALGGHLPLIKNSQEQEELAEKTISSIHSIGDHSCEGQRRWISMVQDVKRTVS